MGGEPKFYLRRFPVWGGGWRYCVAEFGTGKVASSMFESRKAAEVLLEQMEADWQASQGGPAKPGSTPE